MSEVVKNDPQRGRDQAGARLLELRRAAGLSQAELSRLVGVHVTFISQLETGRTRCASDQIALLAAALKTDAKALGRQLLSFYDPALFSLIFEQRPQAAGQRAGASPDSPPDTRFKDIILDVLKERGTGMTAPELQRETEERLGRSLHYNTAYMTLRRHAKAGRVLQTGLVWTLVSAD